MVVDLHELTLGKIILNQSVHRVTQNGAAFRIHYWGAMQRHYDNTLHKHSFFEVCYVLEGTGYYIDNHYTYSLQKNTMFFSRPDVLHQIKSERGLFLLYVGFELIESESNEEWIRIFEKARHCSEVMIQLQGDTAATLLWKSLLIHATKSEDAFVEEILTSLAHSLVVSLLQVFVQYSRHEKHRNLIETSSPLLSHVKLYIKDNLSNSLKLAEVAKQFHISGRHLSRMFVSELGINYSGFVQNERIQRAAALLKTTNLSIKEIAEETGFATVQYFNRVFTSALGNSPGHFRSLYTNRKTSKYEPD